MLFSPYVLTRLPAYNLSNLDSFAIEPSKDIDIENLIEDRRKHFLSFIKSNDLMISLPLSSYTLYNAIPHYEFHSFVKIRKKEKQTERALMKYLCRMSLNASPLAAFAKVQFMDWSEKVQAPTSNYVFKLSLEQRKEFFDLCYCDVGLQGIMRYRLNPSLCKTATGYSYIHKSADHNSKVELVDDSDFAEAVRILRSTDFTFAQFVDKVDYDVNEFLESQLIVPSYPIFDDEKTQQEIIKSINERHKLSFRFSDLSIAQFTNLTPSLVLELQSHWIKEIKKYAKALDVSIDSVLRPERLYYLNTYADKMLTNYPELNKEVIAKDVLKLVRLIDQATINTTAKVSKDKLNEQQEIMPVKFDLKNIVIQKMEDESIMLPLHSVKESDRLEDFGLMLSHTTNGIKLMNITPAQGKFFSPALVLASQKVKEAVGNWITENANYKVAVKDESLHSKNSGNKYIKEMESFGLDFQHPISERVIVDINNDNQSINAANGEVVELVNLGTEQIKARSEYLQNLYTHTTQRPNIPVFILAMQQKYKFTIKENIDVLPSIKGKNFILGYKKWVISAKEIFQPFAGSVEENILPINEWRKELKMPRLISYIIDGGKPLYNDFLNVWTLHAFLKMVRSMERKCVISDLGFGETIKNEQVIESYFEVKV